MRPLPLVLVLVLSALAPALVRADVDGGRGPAPAGFDRSTPQATVASFRAALDEGDYEAASFALDLRGVPREARPARGIEYARMLDEVIESYGLDLEARVARAPMVGSRMNLGQLPSDGQLASLTLESGGDERGHRQWVFSRETVASLEGMRREIPLTWVVRALPVDLRVPVVLGLRPWQWAGLAISIGVLALVFMLGRLSARGIARVLARRAKLGPEAAAKSKDRFANPSGALLASLASVGLVNVLRANGSAGYWLSRVTVVALILTAGWVCARLIDAIADGIEEREAASEGGGAASGLRTRVQVIRRLLHVLGFLVVFATALMQFESVREVGVSLFASAGLASVVLGFAAQKTLGNLLAGIQISITQPLRIGDDVQIEGDTGTVEEITLSYVVVRLGDQRRLIVPTAKLLDTTFRNYTRRTPQLIGEVLIACDFETPIDRFRAEAETFVRAHPEFDGETFGVNVVDTSERAITLQVVASAKNAKSSSKLRAAIREWAVSFLRTLEGGRFVPHQRVSPPNEAKVERVSTVPTSVEAAE